MNEILLPGDVVINTRSLVGDKGTRLSPGSSFKIVATDGAMAVLVRKEESSKIMKAELFLAKASSLKIMHEAGDIEIVEGLKDEVIRGSKNRKHKM